ncbi:MAG: hypothetical protein J3R72DRAFT_198586, partial [Linnemannia gamsii]
VFVERHSTCLCSKLGAKSGFKFETLYVCVFIKPLHQHFFSTFSACPSYLPPLFLFLLSFTMNTSPDSQTSPPTPKQDGVEDEKFSLGNPKQWRGAIPSVPQALPATPKPDHYGDDAAESSSDDDAAESDSAEDATESISAKDATESNSAEDVNTETETESDVQIQGQVQPQDQDQAEPSNLTINERSKEPMVREEDEKPSSGPEVRIEQEHEISHGPLTANRPSDDDKVEHVKDDFILGGQHVTQENNQNADSVVNEEELSHATINDPTVSSTKPKEPIKNNSLAGVNAEENEEKKEEEDAEEEKVVVVEEVAVAVEEEEEETTYCNVIGSTTRRPCMIQASKCRHHRDDQGQVLIFCNVIGSTTRRPCMIQASQCRHHRDDQGQVLIFCNVIGSTTRRPCMIQASQCRHHRDDQGRVLTFCNVIGSTTRRPCMIQASQCRHHRDGQGQVLPLCNVIDTTTGCPCMFLASKCPHHRNKQRWY